MQLIQDLREKYGSRLLLVPIPLRPQLLLFDPKDVAQVLSNTPVPFGTETWEKRAVLEHFELGHILISGPEERPKIRKLHEQALATGKRSHLFAARFSGIINEELQSLLPTDDHSELTLNYNDFIKTWFRIVRRIVFGDAARDDEELTEELDDVRARANWGFLESVDKPHLETFLARLKRYVEKAEHGSLVSLLPKDTGLDLESQVAHWIFAFDPAGIVTFRALALLGCQPDQQERAVAEANAEGFDRPFTRAVVLDTIRLWPTTPAILRELTEDYFIGGKMVKKGTSVVIYAPFFHRNKSLASPHQMRTITWIHNEEDADLSDGLVPFSAGPAKCPGHNLVPMVLNLFINDLLSKAEVGLVELVINPEALPGTLNHTEVKLRLSRRGNNPV